MGLAKANAFIVQRISSPDAETLLTSRCVQASQSSGKASGAMREAKQDLSP